MGDFHALSRGRLGVHAISDACTRTNRPLAKCSWNSINPASTVRPSFLPGGTDQDISYDCAVLSAPAFIGWIHPVGMIEAIRNIGPPDTGRESVPLPSTSEPRWGDPYARSYFHCAASGSATSNCSELQYKTPGSPCFLVLIAAFPFLLVYLLVVSLPSTVPYRIARASPFHCFFPFAMASARTFPAIKSIRSYVIAGVGSGADRVMTGL